MIVVMSGCYDMEKYFIITEKIIGVDVFNKLKECNKNRDRKLALLFYVLKPRGNRHIFYIDNDIQNGRRILFNPMWCTDAFKLNEDFYIVKSFDFVGELSYDFLKNNYDLIDPDKNEIKLSQKRWDILMKNIVVMR